MPWTNSPDAQRASAETYGPEYRRSRAIARRRARGRCECPGTCGKHQGTCGRRAPLQCDHIVNAAAGGSHHPSNLRMVCLPCHRAKTAREGGGNRPAKPQDPEPTTRTAW